MGKENRWTQKDLEQKGLVQNEDGSYSRKIAGEIYTRKSSSALFTKKEVFGKTPTIVSEQTTISPPLASVLTITGLVAGLNGSKGLMRSHWTNTKRQKTIYKQIIQQHLNDKKIRKHLGAVTIEYIGYKSILMDWDNFSSSFKHIGDSLKDMNIILDDKPKIVTQFMPSQIKCKRDEQKVVIIIKDV